MPFLVDAEKRVEKLVFPQLLQFQTARFQKLLEMGVSNSAPENGTARLGGATFWKIVSLIG